MSEFLKSKEFLSSAIIERRSLDYSNMCTFGIDFLDDNLGGILKHELVVLTGDSGKGKTEQAVAIAVHNAKRGKRVAAFFLEGGKNEFAERILYKEMLEIIEKKDLYIENMDFRQYQMNNIKGELVKEIEKEAAINLERQLKTLMLYDKREGLTKQNLSAKITMLQDDSNKLDLVIIDHLHYFDMFSVESENKQISEIMKTIKTCNNVLDIPVLLVSHIRKSMGKPTYLCPGMRELKGSSSIFQTADMIISMASYKDIHDFDTGMFGTLIRIAKSRSCAGGKEAFKYFNLKNRTFTKGYIKCYETWDRGELSIKLCDEDENTTKDQCLEKLKNGNN